MTTDIDALNTEILVESRKLARDLETKLEGDPEAELRAWLHVAARREAMVSELYGKAQRSRRLPEPRVPACEVAWETLTLIWQQEETHTRFIEVKLKDGVLKERALSAELMIWLGTLDAKLLSSLTGRPGLRRILSKLIVRLGTLVVPDAVPDFARELAELELRELFLLFSALETTARLCYGRMEELAESLADRLAGAGRPGLQMENLARELRLKRLDETFHEQAFQEMAGWVVSGQFDTSLPEDRCGQRLRRLLPRGERSVGDPDSPHVLTDGGLGRLFARLGLPVIVAPSVGA
jgi:hypothetical protein